MKKYILIALGLLSLALAVIGIVVPGIPTTPFLLLSAWLFARSSKRLLGYLHSNKYLSRYITSYQKRRGILLWQKIYAITLMWCAVTISILLRIDNITIKWVLFCVAIIGTIVMGFVIPTYRDK